jgi:hypothetical protein
MTARTVIPEDVLKKCHDIMMNDGKWADARKLAGVSETAIRNAFKRKGWYHKFARQPVYVEPGTCWDRDMAQKFLAMPLPLPATLEAA